jgi:hypothetical protein
LIKDDQLATHARMFQVGDAFFVPTLKITAVTKFENRAKAGNLEPDDLAAAIDIPYSAGGRQDNEMKSCVFDCLVNAPDRSVLNERVRTAIGGVENLSFDLYERVKYGPQSEQGSAKKQEQTQTPMDVEYSFV